MLSPLIGVQDVSLAWAAGKAQFCEVEGRPNLSPWVKAFVQPFAADDGSTDLKKNVTIEDAHKAASAATTNGADYSKHGQTPANGCVAADEQPAPDQRADTAQDHAEFVDGEI